MFLSLGSVLIGAVYGHSIQYAFAISSYMVDLAKFRIHFEDIIMPGAIYEKKLKIFCMNFCHKAEVGRLPFPP